MGKAETHPLVSVLIPCHNAERWIADAVNSGLNQTWGNVEVIVVDDGSSDGSREILAGFGNRIRWESHANRGPNVTRNRLLELAGGTWLQYLDADDYLLADKIRWQLDALVSDQEESSGSRGHTLDPIDVIYSPVLVEEWVGGVSRQLQTSELDPQRDVYSQWFSWQLPQTGGALWRKEAILEAGGWHEAPPGQVPCCEHDLYARALRCGARFQFVDKPGAVYRIWSEDTLCRRSPVKIIETKNRLFDEMIPWLKEQRLWTEGHRLAAAEACFRMARSWATHDLPAAEAYFRRRQAERLMDAVGVAAPRSYRMTLGLIGFAWAERIASWKRSFRPLG